MRKIFLPWSNNTLSAWLWQNNQKTIISVPELNFSCYADCESEAVFKLFSSLIQYYQELTSTPAKLTPQAIAHLDLLKTWVSGIEAKMTDKQSDDLVKQVSLTKR